MSFSLWPTYRHHVCPPSLSLTRLIPSPPWAISCHVRSPQIHRIITATHTEKRSSLPWPSARKIIGKYLITATKCNNRRHHIVKRTSTTGYPVLHSFPCPYAPCSGQHLIDSRQENHKIVFTTKSHLR